MTIRPVAQPNVQPGPKLPGKVAVLCSKRTQTYVYHAESINLKGAFHSYDFELGPSLCHALTRSVDNVYQGPVLTSKMPGAEEYPLVVVFSLQKTQVDVSFEDNPFTPSARGSSAMEVEVEAIDGKTLSSLHRSAVKGRSFQVRPLSAVSSREAEKVFAAAIESCIQQLSENTTALLTRWATEKT